MTAKLPRFPNLSRIITRRCTSAGLNIARKAITKSKRRKRRPSFFEGRLLCFPPSNGTGVAYGRTHGSAQNHTTRAHTTKTFDPFGNDFPDQRQINVTKQPRTNEITVSLLAIIQVEMQHKRLLILLMLWLFGASSLMAQRLGGGLMVGPAFSTMKISGNDSTTFRADFTGGVRIALIPKRSIIGGEVDVIYSRQGMRSRAGLDESGNTIRFLEKSHYINVPLLLNVYSVSGMKTTRTNPR